MATLLELNTIEVNSTAEPGDPANPDIVAARELRAKIRSAVIKRAGALLGRSLPTEDRGEALEALAWAQQTLQNPSAAASVVLRLALARAPGAATPSAILSAADQTIEDVITPILPLLAKGLHPGRR